MRKIILCLVIGGFCWLTGSVAGLAADLPVYMYITEESPPDNFTENGQLKGLSVELLKKMWEKMGVPAQKIEVLPWSRGYEMIRTQPNTVLFAMTRIPEREKLFKWVGPTRTTKFIVVARKDAPIKITKKEDLQKYHIGTVRNDYSEAMILKAGVAEGALDRSDDNPTVARKFKAGRIDLVVYSELGLDSFLKNVGMSKKDCRVVYTLPGADISYAFHKDTPAAEIKRFQQALDAVLKDKSYMQLLNKYQLTSGR
jgi:polar amino acid transport system substrate-binding protein